MHSHTCCGPVVVQMQQQRCALLRERTQNAGQSRRLDATLDGGDVQSGRCAVRAACGMGGGPMPRSP
ncbi:hypothetical protein XFF6990_280067 [Xanthomonas citri pv. fuscans]|nr:hypothetical protein XFF6990_280067 [Xanthomonas citri pv. fuscans]